MSRDHREPPTSGPAGAARWADYLEWFRESAIAGVGALPDAARRSSRLPSGWTPVELLSHLRHMEQRWFVWGFLAEPVPAPWGDWNVADPADPAGPTAGASGPDGLRWAVPDDVGIDELVADLRRTGDRTRSILVEHPLDARGRTGGRFHDEPPTLEWICFHVMADYARHLGHLDIVVELDGR